jgi:polynucleotide 5'-kinase involved in rRNA processing
MISIYNRAEGKTRIVKHIINTYSVDAPTKEQRDERTRRLREATKQYFKGNLNEALETLHVPTYYDGEEK